MVRGAQGVESPGAIYNVEPGYGQTIGKAPAFTMPSSRPPPPDTSTTPGAAAYLLKKDTAAYKFAASPSFPIAACIRTNWQAVLGGAESPGPGAHDCARGIGKPDIRACLKHTSCLHALHTWLSRGCQSTRQQCRRRSHLHMLAQPAEHALSSRGHQLCSH
jgi:hypothetical protein